ncbi:hypothetical protein, partial [[Ruminococcus] torques]|uniref:hypothetical protein n=1 Tax=[Ruminococcus] torques TaxID=33039 RepID=UPI001D06C3C0
LKSSRGFFLSYLKIKRLQLTKPSPAKGADCYLSPRNSKRRFPHHKTHKILIHENHLPNDPQFLDKPHGLSGVSCSKV